MVKYFLHAPNQPYCLHGVATEHVYLDIDSVFSDFIFQIMLCQNCSTPVQRLPRKSEDRYTIVDS